MKLIKLFQFDMKTCVKLCEVSDNVVGIRKPFTKSKKTLIPFLFVTGSQNTKSYQLIGGSIMSQNKLSAKSVVPKQERNLIS